MEHYDPSSTPRWTIKKNFFSEFTFTTLTTALRRVGEFNTSLIARLKLPKKLIITRSRHEKNEKKNHLESSTRPPSGPNKKDEI